jgi:phosphohistidine swiveling domain-containing protein
MKIISWQPRLDKSGPLLWNNVTFQCVADIQKIYGVPYDWICLRENRHYRYYINTEALNRSGKMLYGQLKRKPGATLKIIRQHKSLLRNLRFVYRKQLRANIKKLNRQQTNILFKQTLEAHTPANGFVFFGGIIDTWANQIEYLLQKKIPSGQVKRTLISLLTHNNKEIPNIKLSKEIRLAVDVIRNVGQAMFEIREQIEKNRAIFAKVLDDIRKSMKIKASDWEYVSLRQVTDFLESGIPPSKVEIRENMGISVFAIVNSEKTELHGAAAKEWSEKLITYDNVLQKRILRGTCASKGKVSGRVRIIHDSNDFSRFQTGEVLVTFITTPPFVPIMAKSVAIITEVGGITSHAAVVSRELGKPCVVGVRDATKILKTGEIVKIDADRGVITRKK